MRYISWLPFVLAAVLVVGCDSIKDELNDAVPSISISGGVFGLNGSTGAEMSGEFNPASKAGAVAATAYFSLLTGFDDADAGDFAELEELVTNLGVAVESGNVGMKLVNTGGGTYPASITATFWQLDFQISDSGSLVGPPGFLASSAVVTFSRSPVCSGGLPAECPYTVSAGAVDQLASLFPIEITDPDYLALLADVVFQRDGESNTPNTLDLSLQVEVTNSSAELAGLDALIRVGEHETQITPIIF